LGAAIPSVADQWVAVFVQRLRELGWVDGGLSQYSYLSWRDTKAAIILLNRNKGFSQMLAKIKEAAASHLHRKHGPKDESETRFRYVFGNPLYHSREIILIAVRVGTISIARRWPA
jgi:hypothetical protein